MCVCVEGGGGCKWCGHKEICRPLPDTLQIVITEDELGLADPSNQDRSHVGPGASLVLARLLIPPTHTTLHMLTQDARTISQFISYLQEHSNIKADHNLGVPP